LWEHMLFDMLKIPQRHMPKHIEGRAPGRYAPGGPNGPAAVLWGTKGGATWKCAGRVSQDPAVVGGARDPVSARAPYGPTRCPLTKPVVTAVELQATTGEPHCSRGVQPGGIYVYVVQREPTPGGPGSGLRPGRKRRFLCQLPPL
jgi:hypothetical protein